MLAVAAATLAVLPYDMVKSVLRENGFVERMQLFLYVFGAAICFLYVLRKRWGIDGLLGGIILTVFALRESDIHTRFTSMSVMKTRFFISPDIPGSQKLIVFIIVLVIVLLMLLLVYRNFNKVKEGLRQGRGWALAAVIGVFCLPASVFIDGAERTLKKLHIIPAKTTIKFIMIAEEIVELAIPLMFVTVVIWFAFNTGAAGAGGEES